MTTARTESPRTIMVVDDSPTNLQILIRILESLGHKILIAKNGATALRIASTEPVDLVLLDIQMPDMNGFEVCRAIKADRGLRDAIVIFLSAQDDVADKVAGLELGASDYITKPFQAEEVLARVGGHLLRQDLERRLRVSNHRLERELRSAGAMQRLLLPPSIPQDSRLSFAAHYQTSLHAGGDYYDVIPLGSGCCGILVADVAGHGAAAAIVMAMIRTLIHSTEVALDQPDQVLRRLNIHFMYLRESALFTTAVYAVVDPTAGRVRLARAGHPAPLLLRAGRCTTPWSTAGTFPLFIDELPTIPVDEHDLQPGDRILFYTDGVTDITNPAGSRFEVRQLESALLRPSPGEVSAHLSSVVREIESFAEGREPPDDLTLLLMALGDAPSR